MLASADDERGSFRLGCRLAQGRPWQPTGRVVVPAVCDMPGRAVRKGVPAPMRATRLIRLLVRADRESTGATRLPSDTTGRVVAMATLRA